MIELLSPVGDFDCLKAAVQNGADSVYFGGSLFSARAFAHNFDKYELVNAIRYAKLRNVKINFTLNTLIKDDEFTEAVELANYVYNLGADAIIVQDLGLAKYLIDNYPDWDIHASTQMTIYNLDGVLKLQELGFKRVVLSRELSLHEIQYICQNSSIEIETFIHGALCISYSGQCLFSSTVGGRSGNRGKCAQPCRLPYELIENNTFEKSNKSNTILDKGYLLSPRDLCGLKYIPDLIKAGVKCFKIEGRMKTPEYVATVTRIYRKYIDLALSNSPYVIDNNDIKDLMQVYNRGGFSEGNFNFEPNKDYVFKEKQNNMGLYIGNVSNFNANKGLITTSTNEVLEIGDKIATEKEEHKYTITELMKNGNNITSASIGDSVTIGRLKGNINIGDKLYKLSNSNQIKEIYNHFNKENRKILLAANIKVVKGSPIVLEVTSFDKNDGIYFSMSSKKEIDCIPIDAISNPITEDRIKEQLNKTTDTPFEFKLINVTLDDNTYIPKISAINQLRRDCLDDLMNQAIKRFEKSHIIVENKDNLNCLSIDNIKNNKDDKSDNNDKKISILLNELNTEFDYQKLDFNKVDNIYIPIKFFYKKEFSIILSMFSEKTNLYIYMPTIVKDNFRNVIFANLDDIVNSYNIKGFVVSNPSCIKYFDKYIKKLDIVANYNFNIFNTYTINELRKLNINRITISPELDKKTIKHLTENSSLPTEVLVYGNLPLMTIGYCLLGCSNTCYPTCDMKCRENSKFYLNDRLNYSFRIIPDNIQTLTTIYNSKTTSIDYSCFNTSSVRVSLLDESIEMINDIIDHVYNNIPFSGEQFTKGNLEKNV